MVTWSFKQEDVSTGEQVEGPVEGPVKGPVGLTSMEREVLVASSQGLISANEIG